MTIRLLAVLDEKNCFAFSFFILCDSPFFVADKPYVAKAPNMHAKENYFNFSTHTLFEPISKSAVIQSDIEFFM